ncbi:glycosyltransferase family 4 protein [Marinibaculum pumilum]|uniref:Glycosyltransferase family 4 protein n=2 Tax=Marinibaculum pumilum TaxID=1766165 RepID=A0ABV7KY58_9PROT
MARLLLQALAMAGHEAELASSLRMHDPAGDGRRQAELAAAAEEEAARLLASYEARPEARPQAWLTYHVYHKAPDIIGPRIATALGLPYLIAEPSVAGKRRSGPWADGFARAAAAIARADMLLCLTRHDMQGVATIAGPARLRLLPPFLDHRPFAAARAAATGDEARSTGRAALAARYGLDPDRAWLLAVGMFRAGDKLESYRRLAAALARLETAPPWQLLVAGAGPAEAEVRAALAPLAAPVGWLGQVAEADLPALYAASDLYVWPAANEAYGMALLEAAAAGCPVVSCATRGVPDVVWQGETGLLVAEDRPAALAAAVSSLLQDAPRRQRMGAAAAARVAEERSLPAASHRLDAALADAAAHRAAADAAGAG